MSFDVFISYSSQDKPHADAICARLELRKIRCWIAPRDIAIGSDYASSIVDAIDDARAMVVVFSQHANDSKHLKKEVERAVSKGLPIVPVRIEDAAPNKSMEYFLSTQHWLDAITQPFQQHIDRLADSLEQLLSKPDVRGKTSHRPDIRASASSPPSTPSPSAPAQSSKGKWLFPALGGGAAVIALLLFIGTLSESTSTSSDIVSTTPAYELQIGNMSSHDIVAINIDSSGALEYTKNWIDGNTLASGRTETFTGFASGLYDIRLFSTTNMPCEWRNYAIEGASLLNLTDEFFSGCNWPSESTSTSSDIVSTTPVYNLQVVNTSSQNISEVYIQSPAQAEYSANLATGIIAAKGGSHFFTVAAEGFYNLFLVTETGLQCYIFDINISSDINHLITDDTFNGQCGPVEDNAPGYDLQIVNTSSQNIVQVHASARGAAAYTDNFLTGIIPAKGGSTLFTGAAEGFYNFFLVTETGLKCYIFDINISSDIDLLITDDTLNEECNDAR